MASNISRISINAPMKNVWNSLTEPAQVKLWQYGSDLETTWEPGTPIRFRTAFGEKVFEQWGTVKLFQPPSLLEYSLFAPAPGREDNPENYFIMRYELQEEGDKTMLTITQEDNRPGAVQEAEQGEENPVLKALKELAEKDKA
ncbi:MAG: ATPase [Ferruginibacter sp.]|nr:ATPase [Ferruginibacter sp.]